MARKLEVELIAHTVGYTKGLIKAAEQTKTFARTVDESSKHIGRSLAFATGGFVAFSGASEFLRASIDAARDAGVSQRQLAAQMKASGDSFQQSQGRIEKAGLALEKFGFTSEDSAKALTVLERGTGNITRAISLQGTAANLARAKNIDLASAANVLAKVFGGQETALRRAVPGLQKHEHGLDLIADAERRLAGQAAAATTPAERFHATLHDTEVIIGTALLPTLNQLLGSLGKWLEKMNRSGQLQKDVNSYVKTGVGLFKDLKAIIDPLITAFKDFSGVVGGTKNAVELLVGAFAVFKTAKFLNGISVVSDYVAGIGKAADTSGTKLGLLARNPAWSILALAAADVFLGKKALTTSTAGGFAAGTAKSPYQKNSPDDILFHAGLAGKTGTYTHGGATIDLSHLNAANRGAYVAGLMARLTAQSKALGKAITPAGINPALAGLPTTVSGRSPGRFTPEQALLTALARDPNNIGLLRQQAAFDQKQIAFLNRLHAAGKGPGPAKLASELQGFYSDMNSQLSTIQSIQDAASQKVTDARRKAAEAAKRARTAAARAFAKSIRENIPGHVSDTVDANFRFGPVRGIPDVVRGGASGYGAGFIKLAEHYGTPLGLQLDLAREQATGKGMGATLRAARAAARRALRSGRLSLQAQIDAWNEIANVNDQLKNSAKAAKDTYGKQRQRAVALAHAQGMGYQYATALPGPTIHIEHFHSNAGNPKQLEEELVHRAKARAHVRRGAR